MKRMNVTRIQTEQGLIACILKDNEIIKEVMLKPEHFSDLACKQLFQAMKQLSENGDPIDPISLNEIMGDINYNRVGGLAFVSDLMNSVASTHAFKFYEKSILNNWKSRTVKNMLRPLTENDVEPDSIQAIINDLNKIDQTGTREGFDVKEHLLELYNLPDLPTPKGHIGIPSGFKMLDMMMDGFQDEDFIVFGARPSMGKTALMLNMAFNIAEKGHIPIIFSLEMSAESLIRRLISSVGGIDGTRVRNMNYMTDDDKKKWKIAVNRLRELDFEIFDDSSTTVNEMRARVRQVQSKHKDKRCIVMIDYLTKIKPMNFYGGNENQQVQEVSGDLKAMAKDYKIPVFCLAQLSRGVESRQNKRPIMSDLRASGAVEQDADVIAFLYRDDYYNENSESQNIIEIDIAKQRNGPVGKIELYYFKETNRFRDLERRF